MSTNHTDTLAALFVDDDPASCARELLAEVQGGLALLHDVASFSFRGHGGHLDSEAIYHTLAGLMRTLQAARIAVDMMDSPRADEDATRGAHL